MSQCNENIDINLCTLETCCWEQGYVQYPPQLASTAAYMAIFGVFFVAQFGLGLWYKAWGFWIGMSCGLILEVLGYAGRIAIRSNPFNLSIFLLYFIPLGLGPAFMTASIYLTLARLVNVYGRQYSYLKPRTYTIIFVTIDVTSLIIQAVGGSLTASAETETDRQKGVNTLIAGLTFQAASLAGFISVSSWFARNVRKGDKAERNYEFAQLRSTTSFKLFILSVALAAFFIFIRCVYRVVELAEGFSGSIANNEVSPKTMFFASKSYEGFLRMPLFLALEGPMIMVAMLVLTIWHPGLVFKDDWNKANWHFRASKEVSEDKQASFASDSDAL